MGFMNAIGALAGQGGQQGGVAGGLLQALEQHPGGIGGLINTIRGNGMDDHVNAWASGQQATATPEQVQQAVGGTGIIERTAEHAGVSPAMVTMAMTTLLPMVVQHFAPNGSAAPQSQFGGLAQQLLGKLF
jgi:uncharacterized protein YidB (DUF937 family)